MFDGGLFLVLLGIGILFIIPRFPIQFKLMAVFIFFGLGTVLIAGYDVGFETTSTVTGGATTTEIFYLIAALNILSNFFFLIFNFFKFNNYWRSRIVFT